jgi:1-acyl-sn-glycerol-3-phosphate acyltransferase
VTARRRGAAYQFAVAVLKPTLLALTRREWQGAEHLPGDRGFVVVTNHISYADPLTLAHFLHDHHAPPRFLAKEGLFRIPGVRTILTSAGQIPVFRETTGAGRALDAAVAAVRGGECVVIYPEATLTRDPELWPMTGKTGAARLALATGCPVVPVAQWGPQRLLPPYGKRPQLFPRAPIQVRAGAPLDLSRYSAAGPDAATLREITDLFLDTVTGLLEELRGESAPARRWDPRHHGQPVIGNPRRGTGPAAAGQPGSPGAGADTGMGGDTSVGGDTGSGDTGAGDTHGDRA